MSQYRVKAKDGIVLESKGEWRKFPAGSVVELDAKQGRELFKQGAVVPVKGEKVNDPLFIERR